jgi:small subunit ribosomal protein S13
VARIAGVDIPREKRIDVSLRYIYGIGPSLASRVCAEAKVDGGTRTRDLTEPQVARIREVIDRSFTVEGDLRREIALNIKRLQEIGSYRGHRHRRGLPVRGQRTRTNARSRKGPRKTVAGKKKSTAKT